MGRSDEEIREAVSRYDLLASELERNPDAAKVEHLSDLQVVAAAAEAVQSAQTSLVEAIEVSREHGRSWNELALALNVSRQAARQRYGTTSNNPKKRAPVRRRRTTTRKADSTASKVVAAKSVAVVAKRSVAKKGAFAKGGRKSA